MWPEDEGERTALLERPSALLGELLGREQEPDAVRTVFQPVVDLDSGHAIGFEALTRGPAGTELESPAALFAFVRERGQVAEFDRACRDAALATAHRAGVRPPLTVLVNVEPDLVELPWEQSSRETWIHAPRDLRCMIEITERDLTSRPAALLHAVARVRDRSWGVALDDVGCDLRSLALMALLRPDVIKLDLRLVQRRPDREVAEVIAAVHAQATETGAMVVAEGIETDEHLRIATALGARLGQGWRFGRPGPLPAGEPEPGPPLRFLGSDLRPDSRTPFTLVRERLATRRGEATEVRALIQHLEDLAAGLGPVTVALAARDEDAFWRDGPEAMERLGEQAALAGVVGVRPRDGLPFRAGALPDGDALAGEWVMVVISPHFSAALVARQLGAEHAERTRFEYAVTHERELVAGCARALAARLAPAA